MPRTRPTTISSPVLPVYGIKAGNAAWFAEITEGDALAGISANVSGRITNYNNAYAFFTVRYTDTLAAFGDSGLGAEMMILQDDFCKSRLGITLSFLYDQDSTYSGMASAYRERLIRQGVLTRNEDKGDMPFYLDILGSIVKKEHVLSIPVDSVYPMTTFREGVDIVNNLGEMGVSNINVRLQGWFNDGYFHKIPKTVSLDSELGSREDLNALVEAVKATGGTLFPDTAFLQVRYDNNPGYSPSDESTRYLAGYTVLDGIVNRPTMRAGSGKNLQQYWYLLSPARLPEHVNAFIKSYETLGFDAVSLRDLADTLYSDMRRHAVYDRDWAKSIVDAQLAKLAAECDSIMIETGNLYALKYATDVVDAHMTANKYLIIDDEVPFFQMVLHGYIDYTGEAVNLDDTVDPRKALLMSIEYAASPHFLLTAKSTSNLKSTAFDFFYTTEFGIWKDVCASMYAEINSVHKQLRGVDMEEHIIHSNELREMRYANGTSVFVNYGPLELKIGDVMVPPLGYAVITRGLLEGVK